MEFLSQYGIDEDTMAWMLLGAWLGLLSLLNRWWFNAVYSDKEEVNIKKNK